MNLKKNVIAVVGLGYVGLPLALEFGKYFETIGFDISKQKINQYKKSLDVNNEIDKKKFIRSKNISFSSSEKILKKANVIIIAVPTPINKAKKPDLNFLKASSILVSKNMKKGTIVVYESTVYPGVTEEFCAPILEKNSGLVWKKDFFVGYSPERINPGDKKRTLTNIVKVISGDSENTLNLLSKIYSKIIKAGVFRAESIKVAEAAKVIENTQRDINIALMNELSFIFHKMNINTSEVLKAASTKWNFQSFKPGLVGGHCIGVDPYYLLYKAAEIGIHTEVIQSGRKTNDSMSKYVSDIIIRDLSKKNIKFIDLSVLFLGLTFKENVSDIRNSKMIEVYKNLNSYGLNTFAFDPYVIENDLYKETGIRTIDLKKSTKKFDVIVYGISHSKFRNINFKKLLIGNGIIYDLQSNLDYKSFSKEGIRIWQL